MKARRDWCLREDKVLDTNMIEWALAKASWRVGGDWLGTGGTGEFIRCPNCNRRLQKFIKLAPFDHEIWECMPKHKGKYKAKKIIKDSKVKFGRKGRK